MHEAKERFDALMAKVRGVKWFESKRTTPGYAHYTFRVELAKEVIEALGREPTPEEVVFMVDNWPYNFGFKCEKAKGGVYYGEVYTD